MFTHWDHALAVEFTRLLHHARFDCNGLRSSQQPVCNGNVKLNRSDQLDERQRRKRLSTAL